MSIHPTAITGGARLGAAVRVGPYAVVEAGAQVGDRCDLRAHAVVKRYTRLGPDNAVHEGAVLGDEPQDLGFSECASYLRIGARNRLREGVTLHRGTAPESETVVGSDCFIMAGAHVAHNCRLGDHVILANNVALAGYVEIADRAFLSGGVAVHQFCRVGRLAMVGGLSKIVQDCLPFIITDGRPGRAAGLNLVGLRRAGFTAAQVGNLKKAYRLLLRSGLRLEDALAELSALDDPNVAHLIDFVRGSQRGFCH